MSGEIGPSTDKRLPKPEASSGNVKTTAAPPTRLSVFTFWHLKALVVMIILSASGMVSAEDFAFVLFSIIYMYFLSKVAFPPTSPHPEPPGFGEKNTILKLYALVAAVIGLILPTVHILEGIFRGDKEGIEAAAPHLFLLASQVLMEGISFSANFSLPIFVFVPVFYNSRRIFTIVEWVRREFSKGEMEYYDTRRLYAGRGLAVANMVLWCFNLFGVLLPVFLPKAFKIYYYSKRKHD